MSTRKRRDGDEEGDAFGEAPDSSGSEDEAAPKEANAPAPEATEEAKAESTQDVAAQAKPDRERPVEASAEAAEPETTREAEAEAKEEKEDDRDDATVSDEDVASIPDTKEDRRKVKGRGHDKGDEWNDQSWHDQSWSKSDRSGWQVKEDKKGKGKGKGKEEEEHPAVAVPRDQRYFLFDMRDDDDQGKGGEEEEKGKGKGKKSWHDKNEWEEDIPIVEQHEKEGRWKHDMFEMLMREGDPYSKKAMTYDEWKYGNRKAGAPQRRQNWQDSEWSQQSWGGGGSRDRWGDAGSSRSGGRSQQWSGTEEWESKDSGWGASGGGEDKSSWQEKGQEKSWEAAEEWSEQPRDGGHEAAPPGFQAGDDAWAAAEGWQAEAQANDGWSTAEWSTPAANIAAADDVPAPRRVKYSEMVF